MEHEDTEEITGIATYCAGSFWDMESVFRHVRGVVATSVGFMGGPVPGPTYDEVCSGKTGHSEVVMIAYNPATISFRETLEIFFRSHNPCERQQGEYAGTQYEPVIFYHSDRERQIAEDYIRELSLKGYCPDEIVTRVVPASVFYRAEECHQQFYEKMGGCYPVLHTCDPDSDE
jgi:peptide-methionine (S)-S-oxide reductase